MFIVKFGKITPKSFTQNQTIQRICYVDLGGTFGKFFETKQGKYSRSKEIQIDKRCEKVLNKDIDNKELLNIVKRLKSKKAVALDLISNERINFSNPTFKNALIKLFNLILKSSHIPKGRSQALITCNRNLGFFVFTWICCLDLSKLRLIASCDRCHA